MPTTMQLKLVILNLSSKPPDPNPTVLLYSSSLFCVAVARTPFTQPLAGAIIPILSQLLELPTHIYLIGHQAFYSWTTYCPYEMPFDC